MLLLGALATLPLSAPGQALLWAIGVVAGGAAISLAHDGPQAQEEWRNACDDLREPLLEIARVEGR